MKRYFLYFFSLITFFLFVIFLLPYFIDKKTIKNFLVSEVSNKINKNVSFNDEIDLYFFPKPHITLKNLSISDDSDFFFQSKEVKLSSSWKSLISMKPSVNVVELISPILQINLSKKRKVNNLFEKNLIKVNFSNFDKDLNNLLELFDKVELINGNINLKSDQKNFYFSALNLSFKKKGINKNIEGNVRYQDLLSRIEFKIDSSDLKVFDLKLKHYFYGSNNSIHIDGKLSPFLKIIQFNGNLNSDTIDINDLNKIFSQVSFLYKKKFFKKINNFKNIKTFEILFDSKIKKLIFKNETIKNLDFRTIIDDNGIAIKKFKAKYWDGSINLNMIYLFEENHMKGIFLLKDFSIPQSLLGQTKYDLVGGNCYFTSKFESKLALSESKSIYDDINLTGKLNFKAVKFKGLDLTEVANNLDQINNFSDIANLLDLTKTKGESLIKSITSNLTIKRGKIRTEDFVAESDNLFLKSKGEYKIKENKFRFDNNVVFKTKKYKDLPSFSVKFTGTPDNYTTKYDFEDLKNQLLSSGINSLLKNKGSRLKLDLGEINNLIKKDDSIDLNKIIDLFTN